MKIAEFEIRDYGPLPNLGVVKLNDLNLFYGKNESGKTLIVDALIRMLIDLPGIRNDGINRVKEKPIGYIDIIKDNGERETLKRDKKLTEILKISPSEFYNVFIIRDSDLSIHKEKEFYDNITDRLLGLRINDIYQIDQELLNIGQLTSKGNYRNTKPEKLDDRIKSARSCVKDITNLHIKIKENNLDNLEEELVRNKRKIEKIDFDIKNLENARNREKYEKGRETYNKLRNAINKIESLTLFNEQDERDWREFQSNIKLFEDSLNSLRIKLNNYQSNLKETIESIKNKELELKLPKKTKNLIDEKIKPEIINYKVKKGELAKESVFNDFFRKLWIVSILLFGIFIFTGASTNTGYSYFLAIFFAIITLGSLIFFKFPYLRKKAYTEGFIERINLELKGFGLDGEDYRELSENIVNFENGFEQKKEELDGLTTAKELLDNSISTILNENIPAAEMEIKKNEDSINLVKRTSKVDTIDEYEENLILKRETENDINRLKSILSIFKVSEDIEDDNIVKWEIEIDKFEKYKNEALETIYDEEEYSGKKMTLEEVTEHFVNLEKQYDELKDDLLDVERNINAVIQIEDDPILCSSIGDLEKANIKIIQFLEKKESQRINIMEIRKIFTGIETREKEKISKLLSKKSKIVEYFKQITGGLYIEVIFKMEPIEIKVKNKYNEIVELYQLSGGALDQLNFSIRLALGEKLLQENPGFFILDDPFIKADSMRLKNQISLLRIISQLGWQILYFTCKDEIVNSFRPDINDNALNFLELKSPNIV